MQTLPTIKPGQTSMEAIKDWRDKFREAAIDGCLLRAGMATEVPEHRLQAGREMQGHSFADLAGECLSRLHVSARGMPKQDIIKLAFSHSSSDFPLIMENVANKAMLAGYRNQTTTWDAWCTIGNINDFKDFKVVKISSADDFLKVVEGAEIKDGTLEESGETGRLFTYARKFMVTMQAMVNDDLAALTRQAKGFGKSAARLIEHLVYQSLLADAEGPLMGDGSRLFLAADKTTKPMRKQNYFDDADVTGGTSVLDKGTNGQQSLSHAKRLMRAQTDIAGKDTLNIEPNILMVPPELEDDAATQIHSTATPDSYKSSGVINPHHRLAKPLVVPHLSNPRYTGYSSSSWYLLGAEEIMQVKFLEGKAEPTVESKDAFDVLGREYRGYIDVAVVPVDSVAIVKSKGAP